MQSHDFYKQVQSLKNKNSSSEQTPFWDYYAISYEQYYKAQIDIAKRLDKIMRKRLEYSTYQLVDDMRYARLVDYAHKKQH